MAQNKRASMREGPLAALFRKTEEEDALDASSGPAESGAEGEAEGAETDSAAYPPAADGRSSDRDLSQTSTRSSGSEREAALESKQQRLDTVSDVADAAAEEESKPRAAAPVAKSPAAKTSPAKTSAAKAAAKQAVRASEPTAEAVEDDAVRIPSPRERLRNVFSAEIPANVMEPPAADAPAKQSRTAKDPSAAQEPPEMDVYAREEPRSFGAPEMGGNPVIHPVIRVVGVGGAGVNAVNRMVEAEVEGVEFLAINTDLQSLQQSTADITLHIGAELTRGLGSGSDTNLGRQAAMDDYDRAKALLKGSDMIFITAGAGGGTGTGAAPIIARIAREVGALAVAIVTKPFGFEGSRRAEQAEQGVRALAEEVDTLIVVPNNRLLTVLDKQTSMVDAFRVADDVLRQGVQGISDLVTLPGLINLDFADVRTIMSGAGNALLGIGMGSGGDHRATEAALQAVSSPLLETSMDGAHSILLSITGGQDLSLWEVNEAAKAVAEAAHPDANIIFGAMVDEKLGEQVWVTVVATGYDEPRDTRSSGRGRLQEPAGEPRVQRAAGGSSTRGARRGSLAVDELDVPEFMPRV
jgi:cell division protein FtsZ